MAHSRTDWVSSSTRAARESLLPRGLCTVKILVGVDAFLKDISAAEKRAKKTTTAAEAAEVDHAAAAAAAAPEAGAGTFALTADDTRASSASGIKVRSFFSSLLFSFSLSLSLSLSLSG